MNLDDEKLKVAAFAFRSEMAKIEQEESQNPSISPLAMQQKYKDAATVVINSYNAGAYTP